MQQSAKTKIQKTKANWTDEWLPTNAIVVDHLSNEAQPEYVAWIDLMGAKNWMAGSIRRAAEIIGIIHIAGLRIADRYLVEVYPVIDGVYLVGDNKLEFQRASHALMRSLALTFISRKPADRFLVRGGIAYGRVLHGESIAALHSELQASSTYSKCLALGISIGQAYTAESKAPPFGFYVDMTARSTASFNASPYVSSFSRWWNSSNSEEKRIVNEFANELMEHFRYLSARYREIEYSLDRLKEHQEAAREYFQLTDINRIADQNTLP